MAKSVLDIVIKLTKEGGADKETVQGLVAVKRSLMDAATVAGGFVAAGYAIKQVLDQTVGTLVEYADQVRRVQNATGASAEDSSKLIQILDDQKISYEQLEKAIAKSGKAYDFSIAGIANMSEQYNRLGTEQEKAAFMQERFGKQWISFVPVMQQGKDAILGAADAVGKNLILTQKAVDEARQYEIAMDNLNDSMEGVKIQIGQGLIPITNQFLDGVQVFIRAQQIQIEQHISAKEALRQATDEVARGKVVTQQHAEAVAQDTENEKANAEAVKATSQAHQSMLGLIGSIANETKNYSDKQAELTAKMQENRAEAEALYPWQVEKLDELNQKYADMSATYDANAAAHAAAMGKIQYDLLITKLSADGLTDAEYNMAQQAGLAFGVFDQASITAAESMNQVAAAVDEGKLKVSDMQTALQMLAGGKYNIDVVLNALTNFADSGKAYGGGGASMIAPSKGNKGYADGGITTGSNSGHWELLHGTEAVIPLKNGSIPVSGGGGMVVNFTYAPGMSFGNEAEAREKMLPFILEGIRKARSEGLAR